MAFAYDMVGYLDSDQLGHRRFGSRREELWGIGLMGLQLWNSIRAVDFLLSVEDVDPEDMQVVQDSIRTVLNLE